MAHENFQTILEDYQIKSLLTEERFYRDTARWQELRDAYHPDPAQTRINISWYSGDIDGFVAGSRDMTGKISNSRHAICPIKVHMNGDKALSESTGSVRNRIEYEGAMFDLISHVRFVSRLAKVEDQWKMLTLEAIYDSEQILPAAPSDHVSNLKLPTTHRSSYRCMSWLLTQRGYQVSSDLPGTDEPSTVEAFMKNEFSWLQEG